MKPASPEDGWRIFMVCALMAVRNIRSTEQMKQDTFRLAGGVFHVKDRLSSTNRNAL
jgi:hypothetical protein